jgi:hypothetical protein
MMAPVLVISAAIYGAIWPWWKSAAHAGFMVGLLFESAAWCSVEGWANWLPGWRW